MFWFGTNPAPYKPIYVTCRYSNGHIHATSSAGARVMRESPGCGKLVGSVLEVLAWKSWWKCDGRLGHSKMQSRLARGERTIEAAVQHLRLRFSMPTRDQHLKVNKSPALQFQRLETTRSPSTRMLGSYAALQIDQSIH